MSDVKIPLDPETAVRVLLHLDPDAPLAPDAAADECGPEQPQRS
jgi:hypothetical protein